MKKSLLSEKLIKFLCGCFFFGVGACAFAFISIGIFVFFLEPRPDPCDCVNFEAIKMSMSLPEKVSIVSQSPVENTCEITLEANQNQFTYYVSKNYVIEGQMILKPGWNSSIKEKETKLKLKVDFKKHVNADNDSKNISFN
jgi:hypothetical protein